MASDRFVSRGGDKLQAAVENFKLKIADLVVLDVGSSTGGFVDCLLQNGAAKVYALDTAYGEFAWKLRKDPRVVVMEKTNVLHMVEDGHPIDEQVDLITIDAGWTRLEMVLPAVKDLLKADGQIVALIKPHYETRNKRGNLVRGVVPEDKLQEIVDETLDKIKRAGFEIKDIMDSPILGGAGNKEFLVLLKQ